MGVDGHQPLSRAKKYAGPMLCVDLKVLGLATQWSFCAMLEIEALLLDLLQHRCSVARIRSRCLLRGT